MLTLATFSPRVSSSRATTLTLTWILLLLVAFSLTSAVKGNYVVPLFNWTSLNVNTFLAASALPKSQANSNSSTSVEETVTSISAL